MPEQSLRGASGQTPGRGGALTQQNAVRLFFYAAMALSAGCFFAMLLRNFAGSQSGIFYMNAERLFEDYVRVAKYSAGRNPYFDNTNGLAEHAYPPLVYCLFFVLSKLAAFADPTLDAYQAGHTMASLATIGLLTTLCALVLFGLLYEMNRSGKVHGALLCLCLFGSGVFLSSYERGNVIILAIIGTTAYLLLYRSENAVLRELAFLCLAVAAAIKCFPAVFGLLLLYEKRWKDAARLMVYGAVLFFVPFLFLQGGLANVPQWLSNLGVFGEAYRFQTAFGWQGLMRYVPEAAQAWLALVCQILTLLLMGGGALCGLYQKSTFKQITFLACIQILFPSVSHLYCAMYLMPCLILFFNDRAALQTEKRSFVYAALFAVIFSPLQWVASNGFNFTFSVVNAAVIALFLMLCVENAVAAYRGIFRAA